MAEALRVPPTSYTFTAIKPLERHYRKIWQSEIQPLTSVIPNHPNVQLSISRPGITHIEAELMIDFTTILQPLSPTLPNPHAISVGCGQLNEAIPWVTSMPKGILHGIDYDYDNLYRIEESLAEAVHLGLITSEQTKRIGYAIGRDEGDALQLSSYHLEQTGPVGLVLLRHPDTNQPKQYKQYGTVEVQFYPSINHLIIKDVLAVGGVLYVTTNTQQEMEAYTAMMLPYIQNGIITAGITDANGHVLIPEKGLDRMSYSDIMQDDHFLFAIRKQRGVNSRENRSLPEQAHKAWKQYYNTIKQSS